MLVWLARTLATAFTAGIAVHAVAAETTPTVQYTVSPPGAGGVEAIAALPEGHALLAGHLQKAPKEQNARVYRLDAKGAVVWDKTFADATHFHAIAALPDGCLVVGKTNDQNAQVLLKRLDASGGMLWQKRVRGNLIYKLASLPDGGFATLSHEQFLNSGGFAILVQRFDAKGSPLWERDVNGAIPQTVRPVLVLSSAIVVMTDGGFAVAGNTFAQNGWGAWVVRLKPNGEVAWYKSWPYTPGMLEHNSRSITATADGGVLVTGSTSTAQVLTPMQKATCGTDIPPGCPPKSAKLWLARLDAQGKPVWEKTSRAADPIKDQKIVALLDESFAIGLEDPASRDTLVVRIDARGNKVWEKLYKRPPGRWTAKDLAVLPDGGIVVAIEQGWVFAIPPGAMTAAVRK